MQFLDVSPRSKYTESTPQPIYLYNIEYACLTYFDFFYSFAVFTKELSSIPFIITSQLLN